MSDLLSAPIALFYVGIDWAAETHYVCILDDAGRVKSTFPIAHTADGFAHLIRRLGKLGDRADVSVGIERPVNFTLPTSMNHSELCAFVDACRLPGVLVEV